MTDFVSGMTGSDSLKFSVSSTMTYSLFNRGHIPTSVSIMGLRSTLIFVFVLVEIDSVWCQCDPVSCERPFFLDRAVCSCYYIGDDDRFNWQEGRDWCRGMGGDLLVINSSVEEDQIAWRLRKTINRTNTKERIQKWWIGLNRTRGRWQWVDGGEGNIEKLLWHLGQPDLPSERDVCIELRQTLPNDVDCVQQRPVICEAKPIRELNSATPPSWTPSWTPFSTSSTTEQTADSEMDKQRNRYIFVAIIGGIALLALIAVFAVICLAVRVRRMKQKYQATMGQSSFHVDTRDLGGRPPLTLPRSEPGQFHRNPPAYAEPEVERHPGYEKLLHTTPRYLEIVH